MRYTIGLFLLLLALPVFVHGDTATEVTEGQGIIEKLNAKTVVCKDLTDKDFEAVGESSMYQMMGTAHESMNTLMKQMMGEDQEEAMHVTMGKRMSGCDTNAAAPIMSTTASRRMMGSGMMNPWLTGTRGSWGMMSGFDGRSWLGWLAITACGLFWVLVITLLIGLVRWVWKKGSN